MARRRRLIILGAGGHGKVVAEAALLAGFEVIGFLDDDPRKVGKNILGLPVLDKAGKDEIRRVAQNEGVEYGVVAIGNNIVRAKLYYNLIDCGLLPATIVHPTAWISRYSKIGKGTVVLAFSVVNTNASIGDNVIINTGAIIEHDTVVWHHAFIGPQAVVAGGVSIGPFSYVNSGAIITPLVKVKFNAIVGAGSVVLRDVPPNTLIGGVPARFLRENSEIPSDELLTKLRDTRYHTYIGSGD